MKPTVGVFSFASCEGCQLQILECEDELLDLVASIELVNFREAMDPIADEFDIAFVEGSITRPEDEAELKGIRERAKVLIALGACAFPGGVNMMKNLHPLDEVRQYVYGDKAEVFDTYATRPITAVVDVDYFVYGCPISKQEFLEVTTSLLMGRPPQIPTYPVCVECKKREVQCLFEKGQWCLGPVTRAGCNAICTAYGGRCEGCRGPVPEPAINAQFDVLTEHGLSVEDIQREFTRYCAWYHGGDAGLKDVTAPQAEVERK